MHHTVVAAACRGLAGLSGAALVSSGPGWMVRKETSCAAGGGSKGVAEGIINPVDQPQRVAIVGATGAVGLEIVDVLQRRGFPLKDIKLLASRRSAGKRLATPLGMVQVEEFTVGKAREADVVFLAVSGGFAEKFASQITADRKQLGGLWSTPGPIVIDNSSAFRYKPEVPLVVPEVNGEVARQRVKEGARILANPNCTTAIAAMALWPLHQQFGLRKVIVSTYQAASGAGQAGMEELLRETEKFLDQSVASNDVFVHPLPFNVIPHIDKFQPNGYTKEEMKVAWETKKIFGLSDDVAISCTAVRIPTLRAHAEAITIETEKPISPAAARHALASAPGLHTLDSVTSDLYPMPLNSSKKDEVNVGRIRQSLVFGDHGLDLFVCGDQLLRGAALNAVLIAEQVLK
eukprot:CAMPEP_0118962802 /NCGR_PEP_ID=MMETSP1173-20130426/999_1 /TAXON_ID=1034831 /ORGANISM="Rhizochromulina marina cf, Strain CCMP1243" /LENGTH=403 /DNA_ID=CAMNT_0006911101 /DNA_START=71 /DNA_END=1282 /DNA_ORIENTATION=+